MAIFSRYIFRQAFFALVLILASLTGIVWIALALKQLRIVTSSGQDAWTFLVITTLAVPNLVGFIAPVALLIASIHVLNRLNGDSELIILTASGGTIWRVARPLLLLGALVSVAVAFVNFYGMPQSLRVVREMIMQVRTDLISQVLQPGKFTAPEAGVTIHVRDRTFAGELRGVLFHDSRNAEEIVSITAERGRIVKPDGIPLMQMSDGYVVRQSAPVGASELIRFDTYVIELDTLQRHDGTYSWKPRERFYDELVNPAPDDPQYVASPGKFRAELHERFSNPLYPILFVLVAVASVGQAQSTRSNRTQALVAGFMSATLLRLLGLAANNFVTLYASAVPLLYAIPLLGIVVCCLVIVRNSRPSPTPAWVRQLRNLGDQLRVALLQRMPGRLRPALPAPGE